MYVNWKCQKRISKKWRHHLFLVFDYCTAKYKDIALEFGMCVACMNLQNIYSVFYNSKILDFIGIYFRKLEILSFGGQNW